jgi:hypothetical protein
MKFTLTLIVLGCAVSLSSGASAGGTRSCKTLEAQCVAKAWGDAGQCQMLYDAAIKDGGVWMSPAARIAAKVPAGGSGSCHAD